MKINIDRLCKLAGVSNGGNRLMSEASNRSYHDNVASDDAEWRFGRNQLSEQSGDDEFEEDIEESLAAQAMDMIDEDDLLVDVDEAMLVQELRRARNILSENKRKRTRSARSKINEERALKKIIEEEVENIMKDYNLTSQWVYGKRKPKNSRKGKVATAFPGIGFKK